MLFETFYPDTWVDSTYQIDFDELYKKALDEVVKLLNNEIDIERDFTGHSLVSSLSLK